MNIAHLKSRILDLAVRGKLTEQRPEDGSAAELLGRVREEKQRLIAEGKIKKDPPLPEITADEIPFEIPASWEWCRLPELCIKAITDGTHNSPPQQRQGDFLYITAKNIKDNGIDLTNVSYVTREIHNQIYARCNPEKGDVLLTKDGTIGIATVNNLDYPFSMLSSIALIKPVTQLLPWYLTYVLRSPYWQTLMHSDSKGSALRRIILEQINSFIVPLIVEKIEQLFRQADIIEQNRLALKTRIRQTRSRVFDLAVRGKLTEQRPEDGSAAELLARVREEKQRLIATGKIKKEKPLPEITEDEIPFEIPAGWEWCRLGEIGITNIGLTYHPKDVNLSGIPVLRSNNIRNNRLDLNNLIRVGAVVLENQIAKEGDILICSRNGSKSLIGKCVLLAGIQEIMSFGAFMTIFRSEFNPYILFFLQSKLFKDYLRGANSTQINQITQEMLKNTPFPLPPLAEQKRIVEKIEQIFTALDIIEKAVEE